MKMKRIRLHKPHHLMTIQQRKSYNVLSSSDHHPWHETQNTPEQLREVSILLQKNKKQPIPIDFKREFWRKITTSLNRRLPGAVRIKDSLDETSIFGPGTV